MRTLRFPVVVLSAAILASAAPLWAAWSTIEGGGPGANHTATVLHDGTVLFAGGGSSSPQAATSIYDAARGTWRAGAPLGTPRMQAAAVMLRDGRVLLTGGLAPNSVVATTELYDQVAGTWSPGPPMLQARRLHTATLLDDGRVLVTAGIGSSGWLASAELFDPQTNSWTATGSIAVARYDHSATRLSDGRVLVAAGTSQSIATGALASVEIYDPAAGTWTSGPSLTHRRQRHTATLLNDGRLLVAGGMNYATPTTPSATFPTQCELYNPATNAWTIVGSLATGRAMHSATLLPQGRVLVTGGASPGDETATTEVFDPVFLTWTGTGSMAGPRTMHSATVLPGGRVLVAGGRLSFGSITPAQIYDGSVTVSGAPDLPIAMSRHTATMLPSGKVLVVARGRGTAFDPAGAGTWTDVAFPGNFRTQQTAALLTTGRVLVVAGRDDVVGVVGEAQLYDPAANAWSATGSLATPRWFHTMTLLGDGRVLVTGGVDAGGSVLSSVEAYDPATGTWSDLAPLPEPRQKHTATLLKDGRVLVAGGTTGPGTIASSVLFDPATGLWTPTVGSLTTGRQGHSATLLGDGSVLVTGGISNSGQLASTEVFNPGTLRWSSGGSMAAARANGHTATLLPDGRVLVAGGVGASGPLVTTEFYDPTRTPASARWYAGPSLGVARRDHTATLLTTGALLVTGGFEVGDIRNCRTYRTSAPQAAPPTLTLVNDPVVDGQVDVTGSGFTSRSHASMGTAGVDSPSNYPLVQVRRIDNGSILWLATDPSVAWTDTTFSSRPTPGLQSGHALVTVFVNGQQAVSRVTNVRATNLVPVAAPGGPYGASVGSPVTFDGSASSDPEGDPLEYAWDFGDGSTGTGVAPIHTYSSAGTYTVTLVVTDGFASSAATTTATVADTATLEVSVGSLENGWGELVLEAPDTPPQQCSGTPFQPLVCSFTYPIGTVVTVTANSAPDSAFESWVGACSGDNPVCQVTVTQGGFVGAGFLGPRTLRVTASSLEGGHGYVGVYPTPLSGPPICETTGGPPVTCTFLYPPHFVVNLFFTTASSHSKFLGWTGACTGNGVCSVPLDGGVGAPPVDVDGAFLGPRTLRVIVGSVEGGLGYVGVNPPPLSGPPVCEVTGSLPVECVYTFPPDTPVQLFQTTANSSKFLGWGGGCIGTGPCWVLLDDGPGSPPRVVSADFMGPRTLRVMVGSVEGGLGYVGVNPPPLSGPPVCEVTGSLPVECVYTFPPDTPVQLFQTTANSSKFLGWGGGCIGTGPCAVLLDGGPGSPPKVVSADFMGPRTLRVIVGSVEGGLGYVNVNPPPLSGPPVCEVTGSLPVECVYTFAPDTPVQLFQTTANGSKFLGWGGECIGTGPCAVLLDGGPASPPKVVSADFMGPRTLRVIVGSVEGGLGYVNVNPPPLSGPPSCEVTGSLPVECVYTFAPDTPVQLFQTTAPGSKFLGWGGECIGTGPCAVLLDGGPASPSKVVSADFMGPRTLRVTLSSVEGGVGSVTVVPPPLSGPPVCEVTGSFPAECIYTFPPDTPVELTQNTPFGSKFLGWGGECIGTGPCAVLLDGGPASPSKVVSADFMGPRTLRVTLSSVEGGVGSVTVVPPPLSGPPVCEVTGSFPAECIYTFPPDTPVELTQNTPFGSKFLGWGGECVGTGPCAVLLDGGPASPSKVVSADFMGPRTLRVTLSSVEGGIGSVTVVPPPLSGPPVCEVTGSFPAECIYTFPPDTPVELTQNTPFGSKFLGWGGECVGTGPCAVLLDGGPASPSKVVSADFMGPRTLRVTLSSVEGGVGSVTVVPPPLSGPPVCEVTGSFPAECIYTFPPDTPVELTAQPSLPSIFQGWQQTCVGTGPCLVTLSGGPGTPPVLVAGTFEIPNRPPTASPGGPYAGVRNQPITFDGTGSSDPDGDPLTYIWDFGDGATGTGPTPSHAYTTLGVFTVTLVVSDGVLSSPPAAAPVTISNRAPSAHAGGPYSGVRTQPVLFSGAGSSDPDGDPLTYAWSFGDGTVGSGVAPSHTYTSLGTFTVSLVVSDGTASSTPATSTATITNLLPAVGLTSPPAGTVFQAPAMVPLAADATDPDGSVALVEFFAGSVKVAEDATAPYAAAWAGAGPGTYVLTARATDESGASTVSAPVTILVNAPPAVSISAPAPDASFVAPATVPLEANASDLDGTIAQVEFFANGTPLGIDTTSPYTATWSNVAAGVYNVTARATDNLGAVTTSAPRTVRVTAVLAPTADAYVFEGSSGNDNFGTSTALEVHKASGANDRWTYLKFDTSALATVTSVRLRLFGNLASTTSTVVRAQAFGAANTTWTETGITWDNKPSSGATVLAAVALVNNSTTARWYEWDLTAYLQQEKAAGRNVVTLVMKNDVQTNPTATFRSRQASSNRPELRVTP